MFIWITVALVALVLAGAYLFMASTCAFTQMTYMAGFNTWYQETGDLYTAHKKSLEIFHHRPPFNKLTQKDLHVMAREFAKFPDARFAGKLIRHMDRTKNMGDFLGAGDRPDPDLMKN